MTNHINTRAAACKALMKVVVEGKSFSPTLITTLYPQIEKRDCAFIAHLCFGVLRYYFQLQAWLKPFLSQAKAKGADLNLLLLIGLYQLRYTEIPPYAIVHATVSATSQLKKAWAKGFINGVLRQVLRHGLENLSDDKEAAHPPWLMQAIIKAWPNQWREIITANQQHPPMVLRVNLSKISRDEYLKQLNALGMEAHPISFCPAGIALKEGVAVDDLPGFHIGQVSVQDGAAQLAAHLLDLKPDLHVLDACAAPGGKTAHILEKEKNLAGLIALEKDPERCRRLKATLDRLDLFAEQFCADATRPDPWWNQQKFDRILLDAPCSASGVIRRHPDIQFHRHPEDLIALVDQQRTLLTSLWPLLQPGGILLYATCSIFPEENTEQIANFMLQHPDAQEIPILEEWGQQQKYGRQVLPGQHDMDGFYYAKLRKLA